MRYTLIFATLATLPGCISINSPLFPGPSAPIVLGSGFAPGVIRGMPDTAPAPPAAEPAPLMIPRLDPPVETTPASGGGRARRLYAGG